MKEQTCFLCDTPVNVCDGTTGFIICIKCFERLRDGGDNGKTM